MLSKFERSSSATVGIDDIGKKKNGVEFSNGATTHCIDVAVTCPVSLHGLASGSANTERAAAVNYEKIKEKKYENHIEEMLRSGRRVSFTPFVLETEGGLGPQAMDFLRILARQWSRVRDMPMSVVVPALAHRVSKALAQGVAEILRRNDVMVGQGPVELGAGVEDFWAPEDVDIADMKASA